VTAGAFDLYAANSDGSGTATRLTSGTTRVGSDLNGFEGVVFSPDATQVAVIADWGTVDNKFEPYVAALDGSGFHRVAVSGPDDARDASNPQWTKNGSALYYIADGGANDNEFGLWVADPTQTDGTPTLVVSPPTSGDVFGVITRP
jgi:Tol biopolymer transport system component